MTSPRVSTLLLAIHVASPMAGLMGQDLAPTLELEELVVYAGEPTGPADEGQPNARYERSATELFQQSVRSLPEALQTVPGVMVQKTANGQGSPYIRGFTGYRTLLSLDGVRYNNSVYRDGPSEYFGLIDHFSIAGLEVLSGPGSVRYGSDAVGGVIAVQSKGSNYLDYEAGAAFHSGKAQYRFAGAEKSHQARLEYQLGVGEEWGLHLGTTWKDFGAVRAAEVGTQEKTGYDERALDLKLERSLSPGWELTLAHQQVSQDDVWRSHSTIFGTAFAGAVPGDDLVRLKDLDRSMSYLKLEGEPLTPWLERIEATLSYQTWEEEGIRVRSDGRRADESFDSEMAGISLQLQSHWGENILRYGGEFYHDEVDSATLDTSAAGVVTQAVQGPVGDDATSESVGFFVDAEIPLPHELTLNLGGRWSHHHIEVGRFLNPLTGLADSLTDSWQNTVGSAKLSWQPSTEQDDLYWIGLSQSFRAPNLADLTRFGSSRSNEVESAATGLEPETFLTAEFGARWTGDWGHLSANYHHTWMSDYIASTATGRIIDGEIEVTKQNRSSGLVQGVELDALFQLSDCWSLTGQLSWLEGELDRFDSTQPGTAIREPLSRVMPLTVRGALRWSNLDGGLWLELEAIHAREADQLSLADQEDTERIPPGGTPDYTAFNLRSGYRVNESLALQASVTNLLNEAYRVHGSGDNEPGVGLNFGLSYDF